MKFRKKPLVIEAMQLTPKTWNECVSFVRDGGGAPEHRYFSIGTSEGVMRADFGDWIIKGVKGEFYPCKPDIFEATYEAVGEAHNADTLPCVEIEER